MVKLNSDNFITYAMNHYDNVQCHSISEFEEDMKRFLYLRKLLSRYKKHGDLKERLILNHLTVLFNCFGEDATRMLFFKINRENWNILVTFLTFLNRMPEIVPDTNIRTSNIKLDTILITKLREI